MRYGNSQALNWKPVYYRESRLRTWTIRACALFMLAAIACCVMPGLVLMRGMDTDYNKLPIPLLSHDEYVNDLARLRKEFDAPVAATPKGYWATLKDWHDTHLVIERYRETMPQGKEFAARYGQLDGGQFALDQLQARYTERFGSQMMQDSADLDGRLADWDRGMTAPERGVDWHEFLGVFGRAWLYSSTLAFGYFVLRFKLHGLRVFPEPLRLVFCSVFWMPCAFFYPERIDRNKQVQDAMRYIAYMASASLSLAAVAAKASERRPEGDDTVAPSNVRVLAVEELPKPAYALAGFAGVMSEKVTGNGTVVHPGPVATWDASLTIPNGVNFDFSGTKALSGDHGSDELDYCVSWTRSITAGLCYYDIQPEGRERGGDMVSPVLQGSRSLSGGWTGFGRAEAFLLTHGSTTRNGYLLSGGMSRSDAVGPDLAFDQSFSAAYGKGPFGQKAGMVLRYEGTVSSRLGERLRFQWFKFKAFAPIFGAHDRDATWSASSGLSYAF